MGEKEERKFLDSAVAPLVDDVRRTLDRGFSIEFHVQDDLWMWTAGGSSMSIASVGWDPDDAPPDGLAATTARLAYEIPDFAFDDVLEPWPPCPRHHDHPLYPEVRGKRAMWVCRRIGGGPIVEVGQLPA